MSLSSKACSIVVILVASTTVSWKGSLFSQETKPAAENLWTRKVGEDWPRMLGPRYDSKSSEKGILKSWGSQGLKVVWTAETGVGYGNGVVAKGRWFQFDRFGNSERLTCHRAETGEILWTWEQPVIYFDPYGYNNGPRCSPVVDEDRVYVYGVSGALVCLSVSDGSILWKRDLNEEFFVVPNFFGVGASPLVYQQLLWVMVGGSPKTGKILTVNDLPGARPDGSAMVAFDKRTGELKHKVGNYLASYAAPVVRNIDGKDVAIAFVREGLLTFDPKDGSNPQFTPWRSSILESVNAAAPVVIGNKILAAEAYEIGGLLVELTKNGHRPLWRDEKVRKYQAVRPHWTNPIVVGQSVFVSSGRNQPDTDFRCVDFQADSAGKWDDKVQWMINNRDRMTGVWIEDHLLMLGENGTLQLLPADSKKHSVLAEMELSEMMDKDRSPYISPPSWAPPVVSHGLLYVRGSNKVICMELIPNR
jgi:outer membrane protein assembly factor BamB